MNLNLRAGRLSKRFAPSALAAGLALGLLLAASGPAMAARPFGDDLDAAILQASEDLGEQARQAGSAAAGAADAALVSGNDGVGLAQTSAAAALGAGAASRDAVLDRALAATGIGAGYAQRTLAGLDALDTPVLLGLGDAIGPLPAVREDLGAVIGLDIVGLQAILDVWPGAAPANLAGYAATSAQAATEWADATVADSVGTAAALAALLG